MIKIIQKVNDDIEILHFIDISSVEQVIIGKDSASFYFKNRKQTFFFSSEDLVKLAELFNKKQVLAVNMSQDYILKE